VTNYDRVSVIVGVILVGIVLLLVLEIPTRAFQFEPLGTPLTFYITGTWIVSLILVGLSCAGTEAIMRTHPSVRRRMVRYTFPSWILPALTTVALVVLLPRSPSLLYWLLGLALGGGILAWLILVDYRALGDAEPSASVGQAGVQIIAYVLALVLFTVIYRTRLRSLITATAATLVAASLSLSVLRREKQPLRRMLLYSGVIGLVLGQTTWALNYWRANALTVGVLMMLLLYILIGVVRYYVRGAFDRRVVVEFSIVAALGIGIVIRFGPR
jgi:intracellular septation protein A